MRNRLIVLGLATLVGALVACDAVAPGDGLEDASGRITVANRDDGRLGRTRSPLTVTPPAGPAAPGTMLADATFEELARLTPPPVVGGLALQATHVEIAGTRAYVAYGIRGEDILGALDVIRLDGPEPLLEQTVTFADADVSALIVRNGALLLATNSLDLRFPNRAVVERIPLADGLVPDPPLSVRQDVPGWVASSLEVRNGRLYVTSATDGGLSALDETTLAPLDFWPFDDARAVGINGNALSLVQGQPGRLSLYKPDTMEFIQQIAVGGLSAPGAKVTTLNRATWNFTSTGEGGLVVSRTKPQLFPREVVGTVPIPAVPEDALPEDVVTNAVSIGLCLGVVQGVNCTMRAVFLANGAAGVGVVASSHEITPQSAQPPSAARPTLVPLGDLRLPGNFSANHVASTDTLVLVAGGVSGVRIVKVTRGTAP